VERFNTQSPQATDESTWIVILDETSAIKALTE